MKTIKPSIIILSCIFYLQNVIANDNPAVIGTELSTNARTYYDLQSNSSSFMIEQNPADPTKLHAVFMVSTDPGPGWDNRNARYFYSTTGGNTWDYIGTVTTTRSGFPSLCVTNDNRAIVGLHNNNGFQLNVDLAPGIGSWSVLDPPFHYIWGNVAIDLSNNKVFFTSKGNGTDSSFVTVCTNLSPPGTFLGNKPIPGNTVGSMAIGLGTGKAGVAYITSDGSVKLIESLDGGVTWGAPLTVWNWNAIDSTGAFRGIDLVYNSTIPQVVFELCHVDPVGGSYSPKLFSKILFWSPVINGGVPVTVDSASGLSGSNPVNDLYVSVCRPVISKVANNFLISAYCKARVDTNSAGNNFFDIYLKCSGNGGLSWGAPYQLTNLSGQFVNMHDCRYPSISNFNAGNTIHIVCQADTIPGSQVNGAAMSLAKMYYIKVLGGFACSPFGITNTSTEIPASYTLKQNYPNPFNPVTQIEFSLPVKSSARVTIYNTLGEVIAVLLNENLTAGNYKVDWDASAYPSGVYFYELKAENYAETKKMVLVK